MGCRTNTVISLEQPFSVFAKHALPELPLGIGHGISEYLWAKEVQTWQCHCAHLHLCRRIIKLCQSPSPQLQRNGQQWCSLLPSKTTHAHPSPSSKAVSFLSSLHLVKESGHLHNGQTGFRVVCISGWGDLGSYWPGQEKVVMRLGCCQTCTYGFQAWGRRIMHTPSWHKLCPEIVSGHQGCSQLQPSVCCSLSMLTLSLLLCKIPFLRWQSAWKIYAWAPALKNRASSWII